MAEGKTITIIQKGKQVQHYIIVNLTCNGCQSDTQNGYVNLVLTQGGQTLIDEITPMRWFKNSVQYKFPVVNKTDPVNMKAQEILWYPPTCDSPGNTTEGGLWWNGQCYASFNQGGVNQLNHTFQPSEFANNDLYINMEIRQACN